MYGSQDNDSAIVDDSYEGSLTGGVKRAVSMGFYFPSERLFGLPEREDTLMLKNTGSNPYLACLNGKTL